MIALSSLYFLSFFFFFFYSYALSIKACCFCFFSFSSFLLLILFFFLIFIIIWLTSILSFIICFCRRMHNRATLAYLCCMLFYLIYTYMDFRLTSTARLDEASYFLVKTHSLFFHLFCFGSSLFYFFPGQAVSLERQNNKREKEREREGEVIT
jgi:hypothetical protein